jgi:hypothetical protein
MLKRCKLARRELFRELYLIQLKDILLALVVDAPASSRHFWSCFYGGVLLRDDACIFSKTCMQRNEKLC